MTDFMVPTVGLLLLIPFLPWLLGVRYIPHNKVGIVEKLWSAQGALKDGAIISRDGKAGYQAQTLRGGLYFGYYPWQYRVHKEPLVQVAESRIGYIYARDGEPLTPSQTLGRVVECNAFQDSLAFLNGGGQRGRQRAIMREGVYALNLALFVVITEEKVFAGPVKEREGNRYLDWQSQLRAVDGFRPVLVGSNGENAQRENDNPDTIANDAVGVVTVHDAPPIESGEIIAPEVTAPAGVRDHKYFQDIEAFIELGGRRGKQLQVLTDGTFFINRWFATIEMWPKTIIPIGYVGVIVSYYGCLGDDTTGAHFRYGEQVEPGHRGVWKNALTPGKYPLNPYAQKLELVPTVNFVLRWITDQAEEHMYDEDLESIALITADGYEPDLPLSLVLHIDYEKAPSVIQRFGDVKRLISQTLDPILSSYFRDVAQSSKMLDLLTQRDAIQKRATEELRRRFTDYDINVVAVLIGRPVSKPLAGETEDSIERLFDQLRVRALAEEQKATFASQQEAAIKRRELNDAQAAADKQTEITHTELDVQIAGNKGEAQLAEAHRLAKRDIARAEGRSRTRVLMAESRSRAKELIGKGEASRIAQTGLSEAAVFRQKIRAYGDPRLFALNMVGEQFSKSAQPLVPERIFTLAGGASSPSGDAEPATTGVLGHLLSLLLAEKAGIINGAGASPDELDELTSELTRRFKELQKPG